MIDAFRKAGLKKAKNINSDRDGGTGLIAVQIRHIGAEIYATPDHRKN